MSDLDLWLTAQDIGGHWCYPSSNDYLEVSFESQLAIVRRMITSPSAKAGWEKLDKYQKHIPNKENFCREVLKWVVHIRCGYAISCKEGVVDRAERFKNLSSAISLLKANLNKDGELFRECRLELLKKNSSFAESFIRAMEPRIQYLDSKQEYMEHWLSHEIYSQLNDNPFFFINMFEGVINRLREDPPLTTQMAREDSESIYFQKCMHKFWQEKFGKPLHGVTADFSNALFSDAVTEGKVRDRVNKK